MKSRLPRPSDTQFATIVEVTTDFIVKLFIKTQAKIRPRIFCTSASLMDNGLKRREHEDAVKSDQK